MADETEVVGGETEAADAPVQAIHDAITEEVDPALRGLDTGEEIAPEGEQVAEVEVTDDDPEPEAIAAKPALTLPAAHRRSLKAYGWDDAEIDQNLAALGDKFLGTAARIHKNRNDEVTSWAESGRKARSDQNRPQQAVQQATETVSLKPIDGAALKKQYGEHELIDALVNPYNQLLAEVQKMLPAVQETQKRSQQAELETLSRQIEGFFGGKELEPYKEVYGSATENLTESQLTTRNKVLETADALIVGAKLQGRQMSLGDALTLAHDSVSGGFKQQAARAQIKGNLKSRERGITLRPSGKSSTAANRGVVKNRSDLEKKVDAGLSKVFAGS